MDQKQQIFLQKLKPK